MSARRLTVAAPGGRALEVEVAGPADGIALIAQHGTPGAAGAHPALLRSCEERGLRHVSYSRPGYAGSDRHPNRTVADCAADVAAIADALDCERFYAMGGSGGAPHALACAALLPERVLAVAAVACPAPYDADGLDWLAGMGDDNKVEFAAARSGREELRRYLERYADSLRAVTGEALAAKLGDVVSDADRATLTGEYAEFSAGRMRASVSTGIWGWFDDNRASLAPWGFGLDVIAAPATLWHGRDDRFVPCAHAEWVAARIPGATLRVLPDAGHLLSVLQRDAILDQLLATASASPTIRA